MGASILSGACSANAQDDVSLYFGIGCFWHVQHEFVEAERRILDRGDSDISSYAGYAGGTRLGNNPNIPGSKTVW
jgi:peptide methionine sulfoxide reductase MsrA